MIRSIAQHLLALILTSASLTAVAGDAPQPVAASTASGRAIAAPESTEMTNGVSRLCGKDANLEDICFVDRSCPGVEECTINGDCAAGERCLISSCCGVNICVVVDGYCSGGGFCDLLLSQSYYQPCTDCQEVVDQNQPGNTANMAAFAQGDLAQSFEQRLPNITSAEIFLLPEYGTQDTVTLSVWDALPNAGGTQLTAGGTIAREGEWARVRFPPIALDPGRPYVLVLESGGVGGLAITGDLFNPYPHGQVYANPGFVSYPNYDYTFRTFAELPVFVDGFETGDTAAWGSPFACTIAFDDAWADTGYGTDPDTYYGPFGVHFDNTNGCCVISGEGNGDVGNWDIEGTYGSAAWGIWEGLHGITFDAPVTEVSLDMLRAFDDYTITVDAYLGGGLVGSQSVTLVGPHASEPVSFAGPLDQLVLGTTGVLGAGVDNIVYRGMPSCP